jgi:hypothetical protein
MSNCEVQKSSREMLMRRLTNVLCLLLFVGVTAACHSKPDDKAIVKDIEAKVAADPVTQDSRVKVESHEGEVTVTGTTRTVAAKRRL